MPRLIEIDGKTIDADATLIELDRPFIQRTLLPELTLRHFDHSEDARYRVAVLNRDGSGEPFFQSDDSAPLDPATADAVVPLAVLTFIVLAVILFGITTASESAAIGAVGAMYLAGYAKYARRVLWWSLGGVIGGLALGMMRSDAMTLLVSAGWVDYLDTIAALVVGATLVHSAWNLIRTALPDLLDQSLSEPLQMIINQALV